MSLTSPTVAPPRRWPAPSICTVDTSYAFAEVADDWAKLEAGQGKATVFQTRSWCSAWLSAAADAGRPEHPVFIRVRRRGVPVLIWPLSVTTLAGCRILHALGEPATQYCDAIVAPDCDVASALTSAWRGLASRTDIDLISLRRVRDDASIVALPCAAAAAGNDVAPFVEVRAAVGMAHWSSRRRRELARCLRKISAHGDVVFRTFKDPGDKIRTVDRAVDLKRDWMRRRGLWSGGYTHPAANAFTRRLAPDPAFVVLALTAGGDDVAIEAGYVRGDTYWCLTRSYNARFSSFSPSHLLAQRAVEHCAALGLSRFDLLAPSQPYKLDWCTGTVAVRDVVIPMTWRGKLFTRASELGRPAVKRVLGYALSRRRSDA